MAQYGFYRSAQKSIRDGRAFERIQFPLKADLPSMSDRTSVVIQLAPYFVGTCIAKPRIVESGCKAVRKQRNFRLAGFFAGFCCLANGLYLSIGSLGGVGDAGDLLRGGAARWELWLFGVPLSLVGLWLWHRLGPGLGFSSAQPSANPRAVIGLAVALTAAIVLCVSLCLRRNRPSVAFLAFRHGGQTDTSNLGLAYVG